MRVLTSFTCTICGKPRGKPYDHSKCARKQQRMHKNGKRDDRSADSPRLERLADFVTKNEA